MQSPFSFFRRCLTPAMRSHQLAPGFGFPPLAACRVGSRRARKAIAIPCRDNASRARPRAVIAFPRDPAVRRHGRLFRSTAGQREAKRGTSVASSARWTAMAPHSFKAARKLPKLFRRLLTSLLFGASVGCNVGSTFEFSRWSGTYLFAHIFSFFTAHFPSSSNRGFSQVTGLPAFPTVSVACGF